MWRVAAVLVLIGCAPAIRPDYPLIPDDDDPSAIGGERAERSRSIRARERTAADVYARKSREPAPPSESGIVRRADLNAVLDAGIGRFLARVEVEAMLVNDRFQGWRIVRFYAEGIDLLPGDVVVAVNGHRCERPDDLGDLWESLRFSKEIVVELLRGEARRELHFRVVD